MPCFTANINENGQLLTNVWVTDSAQGNEELQRILADPRPDNLGSSGMKYCCALLDTGANKSCITERLAESLNLNIQGATTISSVSESVDSNIYSVNIHIPFPGAVMLREGALVQSMQLTNWQGVQVLGIAGVDKSYDVLLGMDFIHKGALHVSGAQFTFCT